MKDEKVGLPRLWTIVRLEDVAHLQLGKMLDKARPKGSLHQYLRNINVRWDAVETTDLLSMAFEDDELERFSIRDGDLLVCEGGEPGRAAVWKYGSTDLRFQKALHRVRFFGAISGRWAMYQLMLDASTGRLARGFTGSTIAHLPREKLAEYQLRVAPCAEQERIVDAVDSCLTRLDAAVATLEAAQARLKAYRASVLKVAVEGRLVPTEAALARAEKRGFEPADVLLKRILSERRRRWEEAELAKLKAAGKSPRDDKWKAKYEEPKAPDTKALPELPEGWCWATLRLLGELNRGKSKHRPRNDPRLLDGPYPFVQTGDVRNADTWLRAFDATYSEFGRAQSRLWPAGTMCITIAANIAETAILTFDACFPDSVVGFLQEDPLLTRYVELFLRTAKQRLDQYAPATAQKNINLEILSKVAVPLPPQDEQRRLVEEVDRLLSVAAAAMTSAQTDEKRIARLRQAVLKWAFEGKLVDQDPNDEAAGKLLQRIRAERVDTEPLKRTRRARNAQ